MAVKLLPDTPPAQGSPRVSGKSFFAVWEVAAFLLALAAREAGAGFPEALALLVIANMLGFGVWSIWLKGVRPAGRKVDNALRTAGQKVREEGLVGVGRVLNDKVVRPILYGKHAKDSKR